MDVFTNERHPTRRTSVSLLHYAYGPTVMVCVLSIWLLGYIIIKDYNVDV